MPEESRQPQRVALYARVSTEEQREGQTIDSQVAELERFARDRAWLVVGTYKDAGWSGGILARPELDRLRDEAVKGVFDAILINDVDRLARDVSHLGVIKRDLERRGVRVIFRKLPAEQSPTQNLMVNILGSFAEFERELIADRTRRGRRYKVESRHLFLGCIPPFGFRYVPKDRASGREGYLQIAPEEAAVVRQMFQWVAQEGLSARRVLQRLNHLGVRPRKGAKTWGKSSVLRILRSEIYAGVWHYNKHESCPPKKPLKQAIYRRSPKSSTHRRERGDWIPLELSDELRIVDRDTWEKAQTQITRNITFSPRNGKHRYLLSGLIKCGGCGAPAVGDPCHGKFYYRCSRRCKKVPTIKEETLNDSVWESIKNALHNPALIVEQVTRIQERRVAAVAALPRDADEIEESLKQIELEEGRLLEGYRKAIISPVQLGTELQGLAVRKAAAEVRRTAIQQQASEPPLEQVRFSIEEFCRTVADRLDRFNDEQCQQFLRSLVRSVVYEGSRVRVNCIIPKRTGEDMKGSGLPPNAPASCEAPKVLLEGGRIATTRIDLSGRNPSMEDWALQPLEFNTLPKGTGFEIQGSVIYFKPVGLRGPDGRFVNRKTLLAKLVRLLKIRREAMRRCPARLPGHQQLVVL